MKKVFILIFVLVIIGMTGCKSDEEKYEELINDAMKCNSSYDAAKKLEEAIELMPRKQDAYLALVDIYLKRAEELEDNWINEDSIISDVRNAERCLEDAEKNLQYVPESHAGLLDGYLKIYEFYVKRRDFEKAEETLVKAEGKITNDYSAKKVEDTKNRLAYKVFFGEYEQDNDLTNGKEPIEWIVVFKDDSEMLLLSTCILDYVEYDEEEKEEKQEKQEQSSGTWIPPEIKVPGNSGNWEESQIRNWLNDYFFNTAFSDYERNRIISKKHDTEYGDKTIVTEDKIFIFDENDFVQYPDVFKEPNWETNWNFDVDIMQSTTEYALQKGKDMFFTRTGKIYEIEDEEIDREPYVLSNFSGVRPALYIKLN